MELGAVLPRFLTYLGKRLSWSETAQDNCFILDSSALPKRGQGRENLSFVYDHSQRKTVKGYEILALGLLTPRNFYPVNFGHHFSQTAPAEAPEAQPDKTRGELARRLKEAREPPWAAFFTTGRRDREAHLLGAAGAIPHRFPENRFKHSGPFLRSRSAVSGLSRCYHQYFQPFFTHSGVRNLSILISVLFESNRQILMAFSVRGYK